MNYCSDQLKKMDIDSILHPFSVISMLKETGPHVVMSGQGCYLKDSDGKTYLSADAGLGATTLGFGQQALAKAMYGACNELGFYQTTTDSSNQSQILLAEKLLSYVPNYFSKIFFANSGSEANESAMKIVRFYNAVQGKPEKRKIITRQLSYHGSTLSTVGISGLPEFHIGYGINIEDSIYLSCPHYYNFALPEESETEYTTRLINELRDEIEKEGADNIAAYIAEPIMGGAGVLKPPTDYFTQVQAVLREYNILLICDEVLCGYGRTGTLFGYEHYGLEPDIITSAKGLTSGYFPLSAVFISQEIMEIVARSFNNLGLFAHGFTSCGHPVGASAALATLSLLEELNIFQNVTQRGQQLRQRLNVALSNHPNIGDIRGKGLMVGVQVVKDKITKAQFVPEHSPLTAIEKACKDEGLLIRSASATSSVFIVPPLIISEQEINELVERLTLAIATVLPTDEKH